MQYFKKIKKSIYKIIIFCFFISIGFLYGAQPRSIEHEAALPNNIPINNEIFIAIANQHINTYINKKKENFITLIQKKNKEIVLDKKKIGLCVSLVGVLAAGGIICYSINQGTDNFFNVETNFSKYIAHSALIAGSSLAGGILGLFGSSIKHRNTMFDYIKKVNFVNPPDNQIGNKEEVEVEQEKVEKELFFPLCNFTELSFKDEGAEFSDKLLGESDDSIKYKVTQVACDFYIFLLKNIKKIDIDDNNKLKIAASVLEGNKKEYTKIFLTQLQKAWSNFNNIISDLKKKEIKREVPRNWKNLWGLLKRDVTTKTQLGELFQLDEFKEPTKVQDFLKSFKEDEIQIERSHSTDKKIIIDNLRAILFDDKTCTKELYDKIRYGLTFTKDESSLGKYILSLDEEENHGSDFRDMTYAQFKKLRTECQENKQSILYFNELKELKDNVERNERNDNDAELREIKTYLSNRLNKTKTSLILYEKIKKKLNNILNNQQNVPV